jgi:hypothetical protein
MVVVGYGVISVILPVLAERCEHGGALGIGGVIYVGICHFPQFVVLVVDIVVLSVLVVVVGNSLVFPFLYYNLD